MTDSSTTTTTTTTSSASDGASKLSFNPSWLRRKDGCVEWETPFESKWKRYADWPAAETVAEAFFKNSELQPDKPALGEREQLPDESSGMVYGNYKWLTYSQSAEIARWIGAGLRAVDEERHLGLTPHSGNVGIFSQNNPDWVLCEYGAFSQALCVVPVYPTCGAGTISYIVQHADISLVFANHKVVNSLLEDINLPYERAEQARAAGNEVEPVPDTNLRLIVTIADDSRNKSLADYPLAPMTPKAQGILDRFHVQIMSLCELIDLGKKHFNNQLPPMNLCRPEDLFTICYTSGSEGTPKGVEHTHRGALAMFEHVAQCPAWDADVGTWTYYSYLPLAHVLERHAVAIFMRTGGTVGFSSGLSNLIDDLSLLRPHLLLGVPRVWKRIYDKVNGAIQHEWFYKRWMFNLAVSRKMASITQKFQPWIDWDGLVLSSVSSKMGGRLTTVISGGAACDPALALWVETVFGVNFFQGYGLTETLGAIAVQHQGAADDKSTIGPPVKSVTMRLVDVPDMGYFTNTDHPRGEIWARGPMIMHQYHKDEKKTKENLIDGFFTTGDIAELQPDGSLRIIDRKKNLFKLAQGEYIAIEYLETVYGSVPEIEQIWVWGDPLSNFLVAVVVPRVKTLVEHLTAAYPDDHFDAMTPAEVCANPKANSFVLKSMDKVAAAAHLLSYQKVKAIVLDHQIWTIEDGLLTPTFKLRRGNIKAKYLKQVQDLAHNYQPPAPTAHH